MFHVTTLVGKTRSDLINTDLQPVIKHQDQFCLCNGFLRGNRCTVGLTTRAGATL